MTATIRNDDPQPLIRFQVGGNLTLLAWLPNRGSIQASIYCDDVLYILIAKTHPFVL